MKLSPMLLLLFVTFALLGSTVADYPIHARNYDGRNFSACEMSMLRNDFLHVLTCRGFVRFELRSQEFEEMNAKIDKILEENKVSGNDSCTSKIRAFWYNETAIIFLRFPDFKALEDDKSVAFWIENVAGNRNRFTRFPEPKNWAKIGVGYTPAEFFQLSVYEKTKNGAICDPNVLFYDSHEREFVSGFTEETSFFRISIDGKRRRFGVSICPEESYTQRVDPMLPSSKAQGFDEVDEKLTQAYNSHSIKSYRSQNFPNWFSVLNYKTPKDVTNLKGNECFLRQHRPDLGEMEEIFIMPEQGKELVDLSSEMATTKFRTDSVSKMALKNSEIDAPEASKNTRSDVRTSKTVKVLELEDEKLLKLVDPEKKPHNVPKDAEDVRKLSADEFQGADKNGYGEQIPSAVLMTLKLLWVVIL
ncbi:hypothetical protein L596_010256 [Steinernema carpocapsae]|uniref:Uncharacterized protein n=1 Tax=Steinernema carpocapsae TaxID=34508 RepID=A0A4U5PII8_STECR|nr:hypothetical protein L596_010256 [Steinernema carpocapsae]